jgi:hypothetical protein
MGTITRSLSNNITTGGVILPAGITNATVANITSFPNASGGTLTLLSTQTASASATISFTTGLDSTYDLYEFHFINIKNSIATQFQFNGSTDGGSNYNATKTTTYFVATHAEGDAEAALVYATANDLAQSTGFQFVTGDGKFDTDSSTSGVLQLFNPSSTTYVKHFISRCNFMQGDPSSQEVNMAGYFNTTSAINAIQFKMASGNVSDGIFKLYGVKKS